VDEQWTDPAYVRTRRRRKTIWLLGFLAHVALFAILVVWPYFRGDIRGRDARLGFGRFAACFYGREPSGATGLSFPRGDRLAYASRYLGDDAGWPSRCTPLLDEIIVGDPLLLYPGVKAAEEAVRRAAAAVATELEATAAARGGATGRVPTAAHDAVGRLAAALAEMAREVDPMTPLRDEVIVLGPVTLPEPARVPLTAASDAVIQIESRADGILIRAADHRGLSRTRVGAGRSRYLRIRRPRAVRGMIASAGSDEPVLIFATADTVCREDPNHCAQRATGVAEWVAGQGPTATRWLSGHALGRVDRTVSSQGEEVVMVAVADGGTGAEVRRFAMGEDDEDDEDEQPPAILPATESIVLDGMATGDDALLFADRVLYSTRGEQGGVRFFSRVLDAHVAPEATNARELATIDGETPFIAACSSGAGQSYAALATDRRIVVIEENDGDVTERFRGGGLGVAALDPRYPSRDYLRLSCDESGASLALHRGDGQLSVVSCAKGEPCTAEEPVDQADSFDMVRVDGETLAAWTREPTAGAIRVRVLGTAVDAGRIVGACFDDGTGLCGLPRLAARNGRVVLVAQEGRDLRVVESHDAGRTFERMRGIR